MTHDGHLRPRRRLHAARGRNRPGVAPLHAAPVHARLRASAVSSSRPSPCSPPSPSCLSCSRSLGTRSTVSASCRAAGWSDERDTEHGFWAVLARFIMRYPKTVRGRDRRLPAPAHAARFSRSQLGPGSNEGIPRNLEAVRGYDVLTSRRRAGAVAPTNVVVDTGRTGGAEDPGAGAVDRLKRSLEADPQVAVVRFGDTSSVRPPDWPLPQRRVGRRAGLREAGEPRVRVPVSATRSSRRRGSPRACRLAGAVRRRQGLPRPHVRLVPVLVAAVLVATFVLLDARVPLDRPPPQGDRPQPALDRRGLRAARRRLQVGRRRVRRARSPTTRSRAGSPSSSSRCSSGSRWTTRCSSSRGCARSGTTAPDNEEAVVLGLDEDGPARHRGRR